MMSLHEQVRVVRAAPGKPGQQWRHLCLWTTDPEVTHKTDCIRDWLGKHKSEQEEYFCGEDIALLQ